MNGAITINKVAPTDTYNVVATDYLILCDKATAMTVNLPATTGSGRELVIKNINTGMVTVDGNLSDTIDGVATILLASQYDSITIVDGATNKWYIITDNR